ncbi:unnamed protein product [Durusdinium trenchii]|uniref:Uncharacterized protein n=1 Tax=Durusdinium trenchii TaxID=1381693 RepID=A0ABP0T106_9DINO
MQRCWCSKQLMESSCHNPSPMSMIMRLAPPVCSGFSVLCQPRVSEVMSGKFAKAAEDAKRYATQHDLERTVTQMVNSLMATKPEDPDAHMLRYLLTTCSPDQLREAPVKITRELEPPKYVTLPQDRTPEMYEKLNSFPTRSRVESPK